VALPWAAAAAVGAVLLLRPEGAGFGLPCPVRAMTGLYCPGCGSSRALASLLRGHLRQAFRWNPLMVLCLPAALFYMVWASVSYVRVGHNTLDDHIPPALAWAGVAVLVGYFVLRNLPVWPFVLLRPTAV